MITLQEIDFWNRDFWVGFMATSFPTAWEEETDMSLTELIEDNEKSDIDWWSDFTKYYDGVLEESDGYLDEPETLTCELTPAQTLKIEFHPADTVYYINDKQIACTGGHYNIQIIPFKDLMNFFENKQIFLLLLPLATIHKSDTCEAVSVIANVLQNILDKRLCSRYAECIINGLMPE